MESAAMASKLKDHIVDITTRASKLVQSYAAKIINEYSQPENILPENTGIHYESTARNSKNPESRGTLHGENSNTTTANGIAGQHSVEILSPPQTEKAPRIKQYEELAHGWSRNRSEKTKRVVKDASNMLNFYHFVFVVFEAHLPMIDNLEMEMTRLENLLLTGNYHAEAKVEGEMDEIANYLQEINHLIIDTSFYLDQGESILAPAHNTFSRLKLLLDAARPVETDENLKMIVAATKRLFETTKSICRTAMTVKNYATEFKFLKTEVLSYWRMN